MPWTDSYPNSSLTLIETEPRGKLVFPLYRPLSPRIVYFRTKIREFGSSAFIHNNQCKNDRPLWPGSCAFSQKIVRFGSKDRLLSTGAHGPSTLTQDHFGPDLYRFRFNRIKLLHALPFLYQFEFSTSIVAFQPHWFFPSWIKTFQLHHSFSNFSCTFELRPELLNFNLTFQLFNLILSNFNLNFPTPDRTFQLHSFQFHAGLPNYSFFSNCSFQLFFLITGTRIPNNLVKKGKQRLEKIFNRNGVTDKFKIGRTCFCTSTGTIPK